MQKFSEFKSKSIKKLETCKEIINEASNFVNVQELLEKIERTIKDLKNEKFKVVFFGGFSDGKTTILSALLNRTDLKISPAPTTDKIEEYLFEDYLIVDTPGLFSENIKHDETSKKFISEADLVIFVTEATNPLKESQHPTIKWLLKDLRKLDQTIFVINKLDETGIVLDNKEDFKNMCSTKKREVIKILNQILEVEKKDYLIVCLAADPWGMGIKYWLDHKEEYEKLSNIQELERIINSIIEKSKYDLMQKKVESVIQDVVVRTKSEVEKWIEELETQFEKLDIQKKEFQQELDEIRNELIKITNRIKNRLDSFRRNLISGIQSTADGEELKKFVQKEIGTSFEILKNRIEQIYTEEVETLYRYLNLKNIQNTLEKISFTYKEMDRISLELAKYLEFTKTMIKDFISNAPITDIIKDLRLKPKNFFKLEETTKQASKTSSKETTKQASKTLIVFDIMRETLIFIGEIVSKFEFEKTRDELIEKLNQIFAQLHNQTTPEFLKKNFLHKILDYEESEKSILEQYENYKQTLNNLKKLNLLLNKCKET